VRIFIFLASLYVLISVKYSIMGLLKTLRHIIKTSVDDSLQLLECIAAVANKVDCNKLIVLYSLLFH